MSKVFIENWKGKDIFYDKETNLFKTENKKLDIFFEGTTLYDVRRKIELSKDEEIDKEYLIKDGFFNKEISKILVLTVNKLMQTMKYKVMDNTENSDIGSIKDEDISILYPLTEKNLGIFSQVKDLESKIGKIEKQQRDLVRTLEKGDENVKK